MVKANGMSKNIKNKGIDFVRNTLIATRSRLYDFLIDGNKDIDKECGYPDAITADTYRKIYNREGLGKRVVDIYPEASWAMDPVITDGDDITKTDTPFAKSWSKLVKRLKIYHYLHRADELSGIGHYGLLVLGIADGRDLREPVSGVDKGGVYNGSGNLDLQWLKCYSEENIQITLFEKDVQSPRFGKPVLYKLSVSKVEQDNSTAGASFEDVTVHWTRVVHLADNRKDSDIFGTPRMQAVYNRIYDLRKILSGSGEMFWKGGFPGLAIETMPEVQDAEIDTESLDKEVSEYYNGLRRYLALQNMTAKSLTPQIADPSNHVDSMLKIIAITLGIPFRIFSGAEEARLASSQDARAWNKRIDTRRVKYIEPMVIDPFVDLLVNYKIIEPPKNEYNEFHTFWPKLDVVTEEDKANVADKRTNAMSKYVSSDVEAIMTPYDFLVHVLGFTSSVAEDIISNSLANDEPMTEELGEESAIKGGAAPQQGSSKSDADSRVKTSKD